MELINELLCKDIGRSLIEYFNVIEIDCNKIVQTNALKALEEIKRMIHNDKLDDFMMIDEIAGVFMRYNIDTGGCHDF